MLSSGKKKICAIIFPLLQAVGFGNTNQSSEYGIFAALDAVFLKNETVKTVITNIEIMSERGSA